MNTGVLILGERSSQGAMEAHRGGISPDCGWIRDVLREEEFPELSFEGHIEIGQKKNVGTGVCM